jgi:hypothetical protein
VPVLFGIILGVILTIAGAHAYDSSTGRVQNGLAPTTVGGQPPMVNWDVVSEDWNLFKADMRERADNIERSLKRHNG